MYRDYFGLRDIPFAAEPDPRYLFSSQTHFLALAVLRQATRKSKGCVVMTGPAGTGKTLLCQACLQDKSPETTTAAIITPQSGTTEALLEALCQQINIPTYPESTLQGYHAALLSRLKKDFLVRKSVILIIDNAHILEPGAFLALHALATADYGEEFHPSLILSGHSELMKTLEQPELSVLKGMISGRVTLVPLEKGDIRPYIRHRLGVAGANVRTPFSVQALNGIFHHSQGVPGRINAICDRAMEDAAVAGRFQIDSQTINEVAIKLLEDTPQALPRAKSTRSPLSIIGGIFALLLALLALLAALSLFPNDTDKDVGKKSVSNSTPSPSPIAVQTVVRSVALPTQTPQAPQTPQILETPEPLSPTPVVNFPIVPGLEDLPDPTLVGAPEKQWSYDQDGVARVSDPAFTPIASLLTLARLWKRPFSDEELGMFRAYKKETILGLDMTRLLSAPGVDLHSFETAGPLRRWVGLNLPLALEINDRSGRLSASVVLTNIEGEVCQLADPRLGSVRLGRSILEPMIVKITVVYADADNLASLKSEQNGKAVKTLESILSGNGFWAGAQTGTYGLQMRVAVAKLQEAVGLIPSGEMDDATAAYIAAIRHADRPLLQNRQKPGASIKTPVIY